MKYSVKDSAQVAGGSYQRRLILVWQNPDSRRFVKVANFDLLGGDRFAFSYLPEAKTEPGFTGLFEYPDFDRVYVSDVLPAFLENRIMSPQRINIDQYLGWLGVSGLQKGEIPIEVLVRTGGGRATDTFHVVEVPEKDDTSFRSRFFVSGLRHTPNVESHLGDLAPGDELVIEAEPDNPQNSAAMLVSNQSREKIGYVPDWLCEDVESLLSEDWTVRIYVEQVNLDAPFHVKLLCLIEAGR